MKQLALILSLMLAGCGLGAAEQNESSGPRVETPNLAGGLPVSVKLSCKGSGGQRQYRIYFAKRVWAEKQWIGAWSAYSSIKAITDHEIVLADAGNDLGSRYLKLDRSNLSMVDQVTQSGIMSTTRIDNFSCVIA